MKDINQVWDLIKSLEFKTLELGTKVGKWFIKTSFIWNFHLINVHINLIFFGLVTILCYVICNVI
jgi:hypothetical protein